MTFCSRSACFVAAFFATALAQGASVVGLRFSGGPEGSLYDIVSIDTDTGRQKTLVAAAFQDLWGGSFITDPEAGIGYVDASNVTPFPNFSISTELFRYELATGRVLPAANVDFGGALALGPRGRLVGVHTISENRCDIVTINPETGASRTLVANAFKDLWGGSFISDRKAGVGYVITDDKKLLQYDLSNGRTIAKVALNYGGPLALAPEGRLIGIRQTSSTSSDIVSINPRTGAVSTLVSDAFPDFYADTFTSDVEAGIGCVLTSEGRLYQFDLVTGVPRAAARRVKGNIRYATFASSTAKSRTSSSDGKLAYAFAHKRSGFKVRLRAEVIEIFRDHVHSHELQEFVVRLNSGQTLLIIHDKTLGTPVPHLRLGNRVTVLGEYRWNDEGGYIVKTTRKADGKKGGWIRRGGKKFE